MRRGDGFAGGDKAGAEFGGLQGFCVAAPLQDEAFNFQEVGEPEAEFEATVGQFGDLLRLVPIAVPHVVGGKARKADAHVVVFVAVHDAEGGGEVAID